MARLFEGRGEHGGVFCSGGVLSNQRLIHRGRIAIWREGKESYPIQFLGRRGESSRCIGTTCHRRLGETQREGAGEDGGENKNDQEIKKGRRTQKKKGKKRSVIRRNHKAASPAFYGETQKTSRLSIPGRGERKRQAGRSQCNGGGRAKSVSSINWKAGAFAFSDEARGGKEGRDCGIFRETKGKRKCAIYL